MNKHIILIHGRHFKPEQQQFEAIWLAALRHGIARDYDKEKVKLWDDTQKTMVYFGDLSNEFLSDIEKEYNEEADVADRQKVLDALKRYDRSAFEGRQGKANYEKLPGKSSRMEFLADTLAEPLAIFGLTERLLSSGFPDLLEYWNRDTAFGSNVRWRLTVPLAQALREEQEVLLLAHSLGTQISYDVLWKFSHYGEYQDLRQQKVSLWVTLGCPLGNNTFKKNLKGADADGRRKYPHNIRRWVNIAAEDDYISHDETVADDYRRMKKWGLVDSIVDHRVYNLAVRKGTSNPHHSVGYLIHPTVSRIVADWLG